MERRRNEGTEETGDPRENPQSSGIARYYSHVRKSGRDHTRIEPGRLVVTREVARATQAIECTEGVPRQNPPGHRQRPPRFIKCTGKVADWSGSQWQDYSPTTKASLWDRSRTLVGEFSRGSPVATALAFRRCSIPTHLTVPSTALITLISMQNEKVPFNVNLYKTCNGNLAWSRYGKDPHTLPAHIANKDCRVSYLQCGQSYICGSIRTLPAVSPSWRMYLALDEMGLYELYLALDNIMYLDVDEMYLALDENITWRLKEMSLFIAVVGAVPCQSVWLKSEHTKSKYFIRDDSGVRRIHSVPELCCWRDDKGYLMSLRSMDNVCIEVRRRSIKNHEYGSRSLKPILSEQHSSRKCSRHGGYLTEQFSSSYLRIGRDTIQYVVDIERLLAVQTPDPTLVHLPHDCANLENHCTDLDAARTDLPLGGGGGGGGLKDVRGGTVYEASTRQAAQTKLYPGEAGPIAKLVTSSHSINVNFPTVSLEVFSRSTSPTDELAKMTPKFPASKVTPSSPKHPQVHAARRELSDDGALDERDIVALTSPALLRLTRGRYLHVDRHLTGSHELCELSLWCNFPDVVNVYVHGAEKHPDMVNVFVHGAEEHPDMVNVCMHGAEKHPDMVNVCVHGEEEYPDVVNVYVHGAEKHPDMVNVFVHGAEEHPDMVNVCVHGEEEYPDMVNVCVHGAEKHPDMVNVCVHGAEEHPDMVNVCVHGAEEHPDMVNEHPDMVNVCVHGAEEHPDMVNVCVHGAEEHPDMVNVCVHGAEEHPDMVNVCVHGAEEHPDMVNVCVHGAEEHPDMVNVCVHGAE
ncbi:hypothetical protein PR048_000026 [Dryococelus australis]|uniref:Uncharacterized protein n=1 Tax=Dryococelus australis TaxID=614101 RepID=A0ABQ9IDG8_9NEOP|nr:hypothetical protein PR048_000026 [Dryococelus australis]